tara:strand:- start:757 stop:1422 length:666 start_codon:yes stop_codon:yes gene_type:complete
MKKLTIFIAGFMLLAFTAQAEIRAGLSLSAGVFEADGASEKFAAGHSSAENEDAITTKASAEGDGAEGLFGIGSIFVEKSFGKLALGLDYVPHSLETETAENQTANGNVNKVQIDFDNMMTVYGTIALSDSIYAKAGYMEVDVVTNEVLGSGGAYGNTSLDGFVVGLGYNRDLDTGAFVRVEANYMEFDGATLTNTTDSDKSVTADGITGYGAKLSIGKAF